MRAHRQYSRIFRSVTKGIPLKIFKNFRCRFLGEVGERKKLLSRNIKSYLDLAIRRFAHPSLLAVLIVFAIFAVAAETEKTGYEPYAVRGVNGLPAVAGPSAYSTSHAARSTPASLAASSGGNWTP